MSQKFFKIFSKFFTLTNNSLHFHLSQLGVGSLGFKPCIIHGPLGSCWSEIFHADFSTCRSRISTISETDSSLIPVKFGPRFLIFLVQNLDSRSGPEFLGLSSFDGFLGQRISSCIKKFFKFWIPVNWNKLIWLPVITPINHRDNWTKITTLDLKVWPLWRHTQWFWLLPVTVLKDWTSG